METDKFPHSSDDRISTKEIMRLVANYPIILTLYSGIGLVMANSWKYIDLPEAWPNGIGIGIAVAATLHSLRIILDMAES